MSEFIRPVIDMAGAVIGHIINTEWSRRLSQFGEYALEYGDNAALDTQQAWQPSIFVIQCRVGTETWVYRVDGGKFRTCSGITVDGLDLVAIHVPTPKTALS